MSPKPGLLPFQRSARPYIEKCHGEKHREHHADRPSQDEEDERRQVITEHDRRLYHYADRLVTKCYLVPNAAISRAYLPTGYARDAEWLGGEGSPSGRRCAGHRIERRG